MPGEIQRYENRISGIGPTNPLPGVEGEWVRYTDHLAAVAAAVEERDRQWREQLEGLADRIEDPSKWYGGRVPSLLTSPAEEIRAALGGSTE